MSATIENPISKLFRTKPYLAEMEICKLSFQNYSYVRQWLNELLEGGVIAECGEHYDKPTNKVLKLYTNAIYAVDKLSATIKNRQHRAQMRKLIVQLMDRFLQSCNIQPIKDEMKIFNGVRKVQPEFHQLQEVDFLRCYAAVIKHGPAFQSAYAKTHGTKKSLIDSEIKEYFEDKL